MAQVIAYRSINMDSSRITYGAVQSFDAHSIVIAAGAATGTYSGNFTYDQLGNVFGQLTGYAQAFNGNTTFQVTNMRADAFRVFSMINDGAGFAAYAYCLRLADRVIGSDSNDTLVGFAGNDKISGNHGADRIEGGSGRDILIGGAGADKLIGGAGIDALDGGHDTSRDAFIFESRSDSHITATTRDRIMNFDRGEDVIDLRLIDADVHRGGNQAFDFARGPAENAVWIADYRTSVIVRVDVNGDAKSDFDIVVAHVAGLGAKDFLL